MDGNSYRTHERGWEQAGMSREGRRTMEKVLENTVHDSSVTHVKIIVHAKWKKRSTHEDCADFFLWDCYVEFVLEHSPSVSVRSPPFYHILSYHSVLLRPLLFHPCLCSLSVISVSSFQFSTLGSDPFSVSSDLALYYFRYCSAITPISPTPSHPAFLLSSVLYCL